MDWFCLTLYFVSLFSSFGRYVTQYNYKEFAISVLISRIYMPANKVYLGLYGVHYPALSAIVSLCHALLGLNFPRLSITVVTCGRQGTEQADRSP